MQTANATSETCPTTRLPNAAAVPPPPHLTRLPQGEFWFGTDKLWTFLPRDGTWRGLSHYRPTDRSYRQKMLWWRRGYDPHTGPYPALVITGRRLDGLAPPLEASVTNGFRGADSFMVAALDFPTLGCWQINGYYRGDQLNFVVRVAP